MSGEEDGTEENPFNTIQEGIDAVPEGGTVNVAAGNYEENLTVDKESYARWYRRGGIDNYRWN